jgi:hypothetical protein
MFACLLLFASCVRYPLILGVPPDSTVTTPSSLGIPGALPDNLCIFIAEPSAENPIRDLQELSTWADASAVCQKVGRVLSFPSVESNIFNFLTTMQEMYSKEMTVDAARECACKLQYYTGGLVTVRVPDDEKISVEEVVAKLPNDTAIAFIAANEDLFKRPPKA